MGFKALGRKKNEHYKAYAMKAMYQQVINNSNTFSFHLFSLQGNPSKKMVYLLFILCAIFRVCSVAIKWEFGLLIDIAIQTLEWNANISAPI